MDTVPGVAGDTCTLGFVGPQSFSKQERSPPSSGCGGSSRAECGERFPNAAKIIKAQLFMVAVIIFSTLPSYLSNLGPPFRRHTALSPQTAPEVTINN